MTDFWSTKLPKVEWLFKQSTYGGEEHLVTNIEDFLAYNSSGNFRERFYVETLCDKRYKYNPIFSQMRQKDGLVRHICPHCITQYDPNNDKAETANDVQEHIKEERSEQPF